MKYKIIKEGFDFNQAQFDNEDNIDSHIGIITAAESAFNAIIKANSKSSNFNWKTINNPNAIYEKILQDSKETEILKFIFYSDKVEIVLPKNTDYYNSLRFGNALAFAQVFIDYIKKNKFGTIKKVIINLTELEYYSSYTLFTPTQTKVIKNNDIMIDDLITYGEVIGDFTNVKNYIVYLDFNCTSTEFKKLNKATVKDYVKWFFNGCNHNTFKSHVRIHCCEFTDKPIQFRIIKNCFEEK